MDLTYKPPGPVAKAFMLSDLFVRGLRVTTVALPHLHTVTMAMFVKVGARFESPADNGLSHFTEHMLFKTEIPALMLHR